MYKRNSQRQSSSDRGRNFGRNESGGERNSSGGSRFRSRGHGRGSRGRRSGGGRQRYEFKRLDFSRFINSAKPVDVKAYVAKNKFEDFAIDNQIKKNIKNKGFIYPSRIQDAAIPMILEGKDVLGLANTGTGKTAAFLIPIINDLIKNPNHKALIIVPTRELANQIYAEFRELKAGLNLFATVCVGGSSYYKQQSDIRKGFNILVATPGRLLDLIERKTLNPRVFTTIVLDEVDRMLDMGFVTDIKEVLSLLPEKRQSLFFSATMDSRVEGIINESLSTYEKIDAKVTENQDHIEQEVVKVDGFDNKLKKLSEILKTEVADKVIVFVNTKMIAEKLHKTLDIKSIAIHGDKRQSERNKAINMFKSGEVNVLIATDVAARGLDIPNVSHVINFDEPENYDNYVHRIGRTGRSFKGGNAITFVKG